MSATGPLRDQAEGREADSAPRGDVGWHAGEGRRSLRYWPLPATYCV